MWNQTGWRQKVIVLKLEWALIQVLFYRKQSFFQLYGLRSIWGPRQYPLYADVDKRDFKPLLLEQHFFVSFLGKGYLFNLRSF